MGPLEPNLDDLLAEVGPPASGRAWRRGPTPPSGPCPLCGLDQGEPVARARFAQACPDCQRRYWAAGAPPEDIPARNAQLRAWLVPDDTPHTVIWYHGDDETPAWRRAHDVPGVWAEYRVQALTVPAVGFVTRHPWRLGMDSANPLAVVRFRVWRPDQPGFLEGVWSYEPWRACWSLMDIGDASPAALTRWQRALQDAKRRGRKRTKLPFTTAEAFKDAVRAKMRKDLAFFRRMRTRPPPLTQIALAVALDATTRDLQRAQTRLGVSWEALTQLWDEVLAEEPTAP